MRGAAHSFVRSSDKITLPPMEADSGREAVPTPSFVQPFVRPAGGEVDPARRAGFTGRPSSRHLQNATKRRTGQTRRPSSGGGTVTAKMDGRKQLLNLRIDPEAVKSGDVEMLQDLILAAVNEAARKIDGAMQSSVGGMLGNLGIGGM